MYFVIGMRAHVYVRACMYACVYVHAHVYVYVFLFFKMDILTFDVGVLGKRLRDILPHPLADSEIRFMN